MKRHATTMRRSHLDTLARTTLALAIGLGLPAQARARVQPSVHDGRQPTVIHAANGTEVVNIVAPGKHGISHNTYQRFDVDGSGLILNNSATISKTQLAGYVSGNANLKTSGPASLILNEVTSTRPSQLDGYMEVAGTPAEVVVANPNGIACDGCGFINTPRAVLTTGQPVIGSDGRLTGFRVRQGRIDIRGAGLDASHIDRVDLLARAVDINAKLWARRLNVVAGANRIAYDDLSAVPVAGQGDKPDVAIDVAALGGMYANVIRLVGTEAGVGVNIEGEAAAQAGDFTLTSSGKVVIDGQATATGTVTVGSPESVDVDGVLASGGSMSVRGHALNLDGTVYSDKGVVLDADGDIRNRGQVQAHGDQLVVSAAGEVSNAANGVMYAGKDVTVDAAALANAGGIEAAHAVRLHAAGALTNEGVLQADRAGLSIEARALTNTGTLSAHDDIDVAAIDGLDTSGQMIAGRDVTLSAGELDTAGTVQAGRALALTADSLTNGGKLYALGGNWQAVIGGHAVNAAGGDIYAADGLILKAATIHVAGSVKAGRSLQLLSSAGTEVNGELYALGGTLELDSGDGFANQASGDLYGEQGVTLEAVAVTNLGSVASAGDLRFSTDSLDNRGQLQSAGDLRLEVQTSIRNSGHVQSGALLTVNAGGDVDNTGDGLFSAAAGANLSARGGWHNAGTLFAEGPLRLTTATLHNAGTLRSGADMQVDIGGKAWNTGTAYALGSAYWNIVGTLLNDGTLASAGDTEVQAASLRGDGTFAAGLGDDGTLGTRGDLDLETAGALQAGGRNLSAGGIRFSGGTLDLAGSRTFAGADAELTATAGDIDLRGAKVTATSTAAFTTAGALVNGGDSTADGGHIDAGALVFDIDSLDNRHGSIRQSGDADLAIRLDGAFDNAYGLLAVNADNLSIRAASFANAHGSLQHAGSGQLLLQGAGVFDNQAGTIAGNGDLAFSLSDALDNRGGQIGILGNITLAAAALDNRQGTLAADSLDLALTGAVRNQGGTLQTDTTLDLTATTLDNGDKGNIKATGNGAVQLTLSGALANAEGAFIGGNGGVGIKAAQLTNAGQIYAGSRLDIVTTAGGLDNRQGYLQAVGSVSLDSAAALDNTGGHIEAGAGQADASLTVGATGLDNQEGRLANAGNDATTLRITDDIDNRGGTLGGQGDVHVDADSFANGSAGRLVAGRDLALALASLDNAGGTVYAARNLAWTHSGAGLGNAGGSVGAGGNLVLDLGRVDNDGGNLDAGTDITLALGRLDGDGRVVAGRDLGLTLSGDYTNGSGNTLKANRDLSLTVGGRFDNPAGATLEAVRALAIHATDFVNAKGALVNSAATSVTVDHDLNNAGRIEGDSVALKAANFTNTGSVMGSDVTARADRLVNGRDLGKITDNTPYQTALIAATHSLNLYVSGTLLNRDASLFTLGDMMLAKNAAGDRSDKIINRSGDIEADGNLVIAADRIINERRYYKFETFQVSGNTLVGWDGDTAGTLARTRVHGLRAMMLPPVDPPGGGGSGGGGSSTPNTRTDVTWLELKGDPAMQDICDNMPEHWKCKGGADALVKRVDTWTVTSATVLTAASTESRMLAGGDIALSGSLVNDASTLSAGNNLVINQARQSGDVHTGTIGGESIRNIAHAPTFGLKHTWKESVDLRHHKKCHGGLDRCWEDDGTADRGWHDTDPPADGDYSFVTLDVGPTLSAHITAGNDVSIHAHDIDNTVVDKDGNPVEGAIALGSNSQGHAVSGNALQGAGSIGHGGAPGGKVSLGNAPAGTPVISDHGRTIPNVPQSVATLTGPDASISLPQSGLYTVHTDPGSSYLVETDPRFANYANFISSDYMLDRLGYDPAAMGKRLGDGFYEERQVLDQITQLTGRRFLSADADALSQYRALMNNAVAVADTFDLSVGVALTADQMASLTKDIVWLVREKVGGQSVLVPVVYLSQDHARQLAQTGAVIAGRNVVLDAAGDIGNNGAIMANQSATMKAGNLLNSGTLAAGGDLGIQAAHDILNQGGIVKGADVSLVAGHDVVSSADIGAVHLGGVDLGDFNAGGITATGSLNIHAGRDLTLDTSSLKSGADMMLAAGRDLSAQAATLHAGDSLVVLASRDISLTATRQHQTHFDGHTLTATTTHHVTHIGAGDNLAIVAGRDIASQGSQFKAGGTLGVTAGRDIRLGTVTDHKHTLTHWKKGHTTGTTVTDDDILRGNTLHGTRGVHVAAGRDATLIAADVIGDKGDVTLTAGHDLHLGAGLENHTRVEDTRTHKSGFLSSSTTTTHDVSHNDIAIGTQIKGSRVHLVAGHDLATQGAEVQADRALNLAAGHDIRLDAAYSTYQSQHRRHHTESSFGTELLTGAGDGQLYTKSTDDQQAMQADRIATGTLLSGDTVNVAAGHDLTTEGAQVAATQGLAMIAGHDLVIGAAANTHGQKQQHKHRVDGWQRSGLVEMVGTTKTRQRADAGQVDYSGSLVGSTKGTVQLVAGHDVHITGSDVLSRAGTVITGQNVTIDAALGAEDSHQDYSMHRAGVMGGVGGVVGNLANGAYGAYATAKHGGQVKDKRLQALYAAQVAYQGKGLYDGYKQSQAARAAGKLGGMGGTGVSLKVSLGASTANSHADTHDDIAYGSRIHSQGDIAIAATNGDLNVVGSHIQGDNVALAASHDLNLLSQVEQHTQKQSGAHAGGQVGVSIGQTTGIFLSVNGGKARAHGNGTTHAITTVDAGGILSLTAGHDALLRGAQARGDTILANIGHDLILESEQDTGDFASKQWEAGLTLVYGFSNGGVGVSGHASAAGMNNHYKSVTQVTGLAAGKGGFQIHVGGNTDLKGAVIASAADPSKNLLDTGTLAYSGIQNEAKYDSWSLSIGASTGDQFGITPNRGINGGLGIPQSHDQSSITKAGIAHGTIRVRSGNADLSGLDRNPDIDAKGLANTFDRQKLAHQQEMGRVAGYVGMRSVGWLVEHEQEKAAADYASAYKRGDQAALKDAKTRMKAWGASGAYKTILHGMVGAVTASLGGGSAMGGVLGASAGEVASGVMQQYLIDHGINPDSAKGRSLMELASTVIGGVAGQGAGAATALQGEKYNRQLHDNEKARIKALAHGDPAEEARLAAAACYLVHCAAEYAKDSDAYAYFSKVEALGSRLTSERILLEQQSDTHYIYVPSLMRFGPQVAKQKVATQLFDYSGGDAFSDGAKRLNNTYGLTARAGGLLQAVGGTASMATGGAAFVVGGATCPESLGTGCAVAAGGVGLTIWGADQTQAGWNTLWTGAPTQTFGGEIIRNVLGVSVQTAELLYGLPGFADGVGVGLLARGRQAGELVRIGGDGSLILTGELPARGLNAREILPNGIAVDMEAGGWSQYNVFKKSASLSDQNDQWIWSWPKNGGAVDGTQETVMLEEGGLVDRFGSPKGGYLAPTGTPISARSLAPGSTTEYHRYIVIKPFEVEKSEAASAFGERGGGIQYIYRVGGERVTVQDLINNGYLRELK